MEATHQKTCKTELERLSKGQAKALAAHAKDLKEMRRRKTNDFIDECSSEAKDAKKEAKTLPKVRLQTV